MSAWSSGVPAHGSAESAHAPGAGLPSSWLSADEAYRYLSLPSRKALYQAIRRGQVPVHRLGRRMRFNTAELDKLLMQK